MTSVGVDLGGSGIRLRVDRADGSPPIEVTGPGVRPADTVSPVDRAARFVLAHCRALGIGVLPSVAFGLSGLHGLVPPAEPVLRLLHAELGTRRLVVADDCVTSYLGALGARAGVVCAAGTGVVTLASDGADRYAKVDGWGAVAGDLGGGYWIGQAGVVAALCARDGRAGSGSAALLDALRGAHGDPARFARELAGAPNAKETVSGFASSVISAASAGDQVSEAILRTAAGHLAGAVTAARRRSGGPWRVAGAGRVLTGSAALAGMVRDELARRAPDIEWVRPAGTSLDGAAWLAHGRPALPFGNLIVTTTTEDPQG